MDKYNEVVFDVEANGLLDSITKIWVIAAISLDGKKKWLFTDQNTEGATVDGGLQDGVQFLKSRDRIICHNLLGYDYHVFEKFYPKIWNRKSVPFSKCWDTLVQSKCQHYDRPHLKGVRGNHGLEYYGQFFKYPKPAIEDWSQWDAEKLNRVLVDIEINRKAYLWLCKEASDIGLDFNTQIRRTQAAQYWFTKQEENGTYADVKLMQECVEELDDLLAGLREEVEPHLPAQVKAKAVKCTWEELRDYWDKFFRKVPKPKLDKTGKQIKETYKPVIKLYVAKGDYTKGVANWFGIAEKPSESDYMIGGAYTRVEFVKSKMSQHQVVKQYLASNGWKPTQWNYEKNPDGSLMKDSSGNMIKKSPKLTEDSFDSIKGEIGQKIAKYNTLTHRRRTLKNEKDDTKGWLNQIRADGRISSGAMAWATGTGRSVQKNIVNVPSASAVYGAPMRQVWRAARGNILISVDMDSAQMRILANYMKDEAYTEAVLRGQEFDENGAYVGTDAHTLNAIAFGTLDDNIRQEAVETQNKDLIAQCSSIRKTGKNGFYAMLFGAGDVKLANTLKVKGGAGAGKKIKESFKAKLSGAGVLQDRLKRQMKENSFRGGGFIEVAGDTWVWCPSEHKLLNYLLMGSEAVLQNHALCWVNLEMFRRKLQGNQILNIHDEATFEFPLEQEGQGIQLLTDMYGVASEKVGLDVLVTGQAQAGYNWLEIH